jgi:chromosome segregation ATPase
MMKGEFGAIGIVLLLCVVGMIYQSDSHSREMRNLQSEVEAIRDTVRYSESRVEKGSADSEIRELETSIEELTERFDKHRASVKDWTSHVQRFCSESKEKIDELYKTTSKSGATMHEFESEIDKLESKIVNLDSEIDDLDQRSGALDQRIDSAENDIIDLSSDR